MEAIYLKINTKIGTKIISASPITIIIVITIYYVFTTYTENRVLILASHSNCFIYALFM